MDAPDNAQRMQGFYAALAQQNITVKSAHRMDGGFTFASGHAAAARLLKRKDRSFSAVFCANDVMAVAAISRFTQAGLKVPNDVSVIGYDDTDMATYTAPRLTTVHIPLAELGAQSCRHLLNLCYGLALPVQRDFAPQVVWRESVGSGPHPAV